MIFSRRYACFLLAVCGLLAAPFPGKADNLVEALQGGKHVDYGRSKEFEVHRLSHGAGLYHLENLADLSALPESGALLIVAPIKLEGGSGGPVRVFAVLP